MLRYKVKRKTLVKVYFAFIKPVVEYLDAVLDNCTERYSKILDVQVETCRFIIGLRCESS